MSKAITSAETLAGPATIDDLNRRMIHYEAELESQNRTAKQQAQMLESVARRFDEFVDVVRRLEANQGRVSIAPLITVAGVFVALLAVSLTAITIVGAMALNPIRDKLGELETSRKTTVEQLLPDLSANLADLKARVDENETELGIVWGDPDIGLFQAAPWRGAIQERIERHDEQLKIRRSDEDLAQNARLEAIERDLREIARLVTNGGGA
ncbi:MAG: hypothetical protein AAGF47_03820 [Planctomycetota bacterium]